MILYVLRHAIARERTDWKGADADRPLTEKGRKKMKEAAEGMRRLGVEFNWILTSPYRRAYDTAHIVAKTYRAQKRLKLSRSLTPDADPKSLIRRLALDFRSWETLLLVGHEPYLSQLVSVLIAGQPVALDFKKGGLCQLQAAALTYGRCATLEAWYPPKALRKIA